MESEIIKVVNKLSEPLFASLQEQLKEILVFNVVKEENMTRDIYLEKLNDYFETYCIKNCIERTELIETYVKCLLPAITLKTVKDTREDKYLSKYKDLSKEIKKAKEITGSKVEDFTRLFVCLYCLQTNIDKVFDFSLNIERFKKCMDRLKKSGTYKALLARGRISNIISSKYNKVIMTDILLTIIYLNILNSLQEGEQRL